MEGGASWLIAKDADRRRMLEMDRRLKPIRLYTFAVLVVAFVICGPWIGWQSLPLLLVAGVFFQSGRPGLGAGRQTRAVDLRRLGRRSADDRGGGARSTDAPATISTILFALPIVTLSTRFSSRGVIAGVAITLVLLVTVSLLADGQAIDDYPPILIMQIALIMGIAILSTALMQLRPPVPRGVGRRSADRPAQPQGARAPRPGAQPPVADGRRPDRPRQLRPRSLQAGQRHRRTSDRRRRPRAGRRRHPRPAARLRAGLPDRRRGVPHPDPRPRPPRDGRAGRAPPARRRRARLRERHPGDDEPRRHDLDRRPRARLQVPLGGRRRRPLRGEARGPQPGPGRRRGGRADADPGVVGAGGGRGPPRACSSFATPSLLRGEIGGATRASKPGRLPVWPTDGRKRTPCVQAATMGPRGADRRGRERQLRLITGRQLTASSASVRAESEAARRAGGCSDSIAASTRPIRRPTPAGRGGSPPCSPAGGTPILCGPSCAEHLGIAEIPSPTAHVCSPSRTGRSRPGITVHHRRVDPRDVRINDGIPSVSADLVLLDLAPILAEPELEVALVAAESLGILKRHRLAELVAAQRGQAGHPEACVPPRPRARPDEIRAGARRSCRSAAAPASTARSSITRSPSPLGRSR